MTKIPFSTWTTRPFRTLAGVLACASLALLLPFLFSGCAHKEAEASGPTVIEVETAHPQRSTLTRVVEQPGFLIPYQITPMYTKIPGFCLHWKYDLGDHVKKDQLLVKLWVPEVEEELRVKKAKIEQSVADVEQAIEFMKASKAGVDAAKAEVDARFASIRSAEAEVKRWEAEEERSAVLYKKGVYDKGTWDEVVRQLRSSEAVKDETVARWKTSQARLEQAGANFSKSKADVKVSDANKLAAEAAYDQWKAWLDYRDIKAPYDGIITLRNVAEGDFLQPAGSGATSLGGTNKTAEPLYVIQDLHIMRCTIEVPEKDAVLLKKGDVAEIHFQALPGAPTTGTVERTSGHLDTHSRTLRVEVWLNNSEHRYLPNMYAKVIIKVKLPNTWSLPDQIIMHDILADGDRSYCFIEEKGKAEKYFLEVEQPCEEGVPVLRKQKAGSNVWEPITGNEAVITTNAKSLLDGQAVSAKPAAAK